MEGGLNSLVLPNNQNNTYFEVLAVLLPNTNPPRQEEEREKKTRKRVMALVLLNIAKNGPAVTNVFGSR